MTRHGKQIGNAGEDLARKVLSARGVRMVQEIGTPTHVRKFGSVPNVFIVRWGEKVAGDHRGIMENGISVLAEVKTITGRNLRWSDLSAHQPIYLSYHKTMNGISLLVWVHETGCYVMDWNFPSADFGIKKSLTPEKAKSLDVMDVNSLASR